MSYIKRLLLVAVSALAACGAAGTTALTALQAEAQLQGAIVEVDGQTIDRDGVDVRIVETGDRVRTGTDGSFLFPDLAPGRYTLDFQGAPVRALENAEGSEGAEEEVGEEKNEDEEVGEDKNEEEESEADETEEEPGEEESNEEESDEDEFGRPRVDIDREGPVVVIKVVLENGEVIRWSKSHPNHRFVRVRMHRPDGSGDSAVRGQVRLREWFRGERERLRFVTCGLNSGDVIEVFLRDATVENSEFKKVGIADSDAEGCASLVFDTKGGWLPLEAESLADLAGYDVQVRMASTDAVLLEGEIPALPERVEHKEDEADRERPKDEEEKEEKEEEEREREEKPEIAPAIHGKDRLVAKVDFVFGNVAIWNWKAKDLQRFRMVAGGLDEGEQVSFQIRDPESGKWTTFATRVARMREGDGYLAKVDTEWYGVLPLDTEDIEQLIGLGVRVVRETDDGDVVLLIGEIPDLVRD